MADAARNFTADPRRAERETREEQYWSQSASLDRRPAPGSAASSETEMCHRCGTEFIIGSRFCYVCGSDRDLPGKSRRGSMEMSMKRWLDFGRLHQSIGGPAPHRRHHDRLASRAALADGMAAGGNRRLRRRHPAEEAREAGVMMPG